MKATKFVLSLPSADLERSQAFYQTTLGIDSEPIEDNMLTLELPGLSLFLIAQSEFSTYANKAGADVLRDAGTVGSILTFGLASQAELDQIMQRAKAAGGTVTEPVQESWGYTGYLRDPDGHLWELVYNERTAAAGVLQTATAEVPEATAGMLIRKPVSEVYEAFVSPDTMARFWFTHSSGRIEEGKTLTWKWEQFGAEGQVQVKQAIENEFISFTWPQEGGGDDMLVEISFEPQGTSTFVSISETGWNPADPNLVKKVAGQTQGWTLVLAALKAYLEHQIILSVVTDHHLQSATA